MRHDVGCKNAELESGAVNQMRGVIATDPTRNLLYVKPGYKTVGIKLDHLLRRYPNIKKTLVQRFVLI